MALDGFWSYVHMDDDAENGRITQLGRDIVAEYELITGEQINLFIDRDSLEWGDRWREVIDNNLESVAFFVAVLTPRYLQSSECRDEAMTVAKRTETTDLSALWLPLHYVTVQGLIDGRVTDDALVEIGRERQWVDWRELRLKDVDSSEYRTGVAKMAERIAEANRAAEGAPDHKGDGAQGDGPDPPVRDLGAPGILDIEEEVNEVFPEWQKTMESMTEETRSITEKFRSSQVRVKAGRDLAYRRKVVRSLARDIRGNVDRFGALVMPFISKLHDIDKTVAVVFDWIGLMQDGDLGEKERKAIDSVYENMIAFADSLDGCFAVMDETVDKLKVIENISRDIRPVIRDWRQHVRALMPASAVAQRWLAMLADYRRENGIEEGE